jgi:hypothetical protein
MRSDKKARVLDSIFTNSGTRNAVYEYKVEDDRPCTVFAFLVEPADVGLLESAEDGVSLGAKRVEFDKLPSPRALRGL